MTIVANAIDKSTMGLMCVSDPESLDPTKFVHVPDFSSFENIPRCYWKIDENNHLVEMNEDEKNAVDTTERPKALLLAFAKIDRKTKTIIESGFTYDSKVFSLSQEAQANWTRLKCIQLSGTMVYPLVISTMDSDLYSIADEPSLLAFFQALDTRIMTALGEGRALREQVKTLVHCDSIESWVDPRP